MLLLISLSLFINSVSGIIIDKRNTVTSRKVGLIVSSNYKTITIRTYFLEVKRLSGSTITYREFLKDTTSISHKGYKVEDGKFYKDFSKTWIYSGDQKEVDRLMSSL